MYTPLNIKTHNYLLSSMIKIKELIKYAKNHNLKALTITDNNMYGVMEFYNLCVENDIKPIVGLELELNKNKFVVYCKDYNGYKNLLKLATLSSSNEITLEVLKKYNQQLICIVPVESLIIYDDLKEIYDDIFESYRNLEEKQKLTSNRYVYMNEILFLEAKDATFMKYLTAIKLGQTVDQIDDDYSSNFLSPKLSDEDMINNDYFYNHCHLTIEKNRNLLPVYECPNGCDTTSFLKELCRQGLKRIFGDKVNKIYIDRLKYELSIINKMGFDNYFLVVWDYVRYAKEHGILVGAGRGSAAGSLVAYCLNITTVDPIKYNLLFERFLNPERITMPDIDIDFEYNRRQEVIDYCINKYGRKKVAPIITFGTLGSKQVVRDVGRTMNIEGSLIDNMCRLIDTRLSLMDNYQQNEKLKKLLNMNKELEKVFKVALKLEGLKRHTSIHAAGVVMSCCDLDEVIPLNSTHPGFYTTGYSMEYLEDLGLLKMDFLALRNLTLIADTIKDLDNHNIKVDINNLPLNDKPTMNIFTEVHTLGIFQFESEGMMQFLKRFGPTTFEDVVAAIALYRPGPMNNIDSYIKRKKGLEKIEYLHPNLIKILESTYGIIIYQEQIMQIANIMAGYSLGEADVLRRAMSKKKEDILLKEKDKFIKRSIDLGYDISTAEKVYALILKFADYGFNRAHSVAYSMIAYSMAYLKAHYLLYFMKNLLSMVIGSEIKTKEYIYECRKLGINILKPDINLSNKDYQVTNLGLRFPLTNIKNVGINAVNQIITERKNGPYLDIYDVIKRLYGKAINRKTLESLIKAGVFSSFGVNKRTLIENLDIIINYGDITKDLAEEIIDKPELKFYNEYSKIEQMRQELEMFGFYLSNHPITDYKIQHNITLDLENIKNYFDKIVEVIVYVDKIKEVTTKNNQTMVFITGSDEVSTIGIILFPNLYENYPDLKVGEFLRLKGRVEKRFDKYQIVVNDILEVINE